MDASQPDRAWDLSAPESLALLWGPETGDTWALSLAILELAVRHRLSLRIVRSRRLMIFPTQKLLLVGRLDSSAIADGPLAAVWSARPDPVRIAGGDRGIPIAGIAHNLLGPDAVRTAAHVPTAQRGTVYLQSQVLPGLVRRGLYMPRDRVSPIVSTPLGQERLLELRQLLAVGRDWTTSRQGMEPELALDFIERAGSALLLLRGLPETLKQMATRYGPPPTWSHSARTSRPLASITSNTGLIRPPVSVLDLLRSIGPGSNDDLDMALYAITTEIERQWAASYRRGTFAVGIGE